jgi:hypothetical protein
MSLTQYTETTLDGFIADSNNSLDWLLSRDSGRGTIEPSRLHRRRRRDGDGVDEVRMILDHEFAGKDQAEWTWLNHIPRWVLHAPGTHRRAERAQFE